MTTESKIEYECGCCMQRAFNDLWRREYICGVHKERLSHLQPEPIADKVWKLADPAYTPNRPEDASAAPEHLRANRVPLTAIVSSLTAEERDVVQAVIAMRQFECLRERREVSRCYIEGETRRIRLEAIDAESEALSSAMKKLTC